jgi:hypothetical protein
MSASFQTLVALAIVVLAAVLLVRAFWKKRKSPGCGADCGAVSPEIKKLQAKLRKT